jgi:hypothetical protein
MLGNIQFRHDSIDTEPAGLFPEKITKPQVLVRGLLGSAARRREKPV